MMVKKKKKKVYLSMVYNNIVQVQFSIIKSNLIGTVHAFRVVNMFGVMVMVRVNTTRNINPDP